MAGEGAKSGLWPIIAGTPVALWLSAFFLHPAPTPPPAPAAAPTPAAAPIAASAAAPTEPPSAPTQYCISRLQSVFRAMAGREPVSPDSPSNPLKVVLSGRQDRVEAEAVPIEKPPLPDWLDRINDDARHLAKVFGVDGRPAALEAMIATLPDPVDSGLTYGFEIALRSLRRGVEHPLRGPSPMSATGVAFFRDRSWLPWDDREVVLAKRPDSEECRLSLPGVMLFRGDNPQQPRVFVLLLAGESPTTGLRQLSMLNALRIQARLEGLEGQGAGDSVRQVRIIGPTFSGSAQSLRVALGAWAEEAKQKLHFAVTSGSATGADLPRWLGTSATPMNLPAHSDVSFAATIVAEASIECAYLGFLAHRFGVASAPQRKQDGLNAPVPLAGVATLSESGTEFGATLDGRAASGQGPGCRWAASSSFQFPFHVSALRDAYENLDRLAHSSRKDSAIAHSTSLDAPLREARNPLDAEANPSDKTRAAVDIGLNGLIEQMSERRVRHVAIHATDIGDAIFLARKIRDIAPDVRLAFFEADALLLHSDFQREVIGSLVVSPYPFLGLTDFNSHSDKQAFESFENGVAEGLYNAVLAQRSAAPGELSEYLVASREPLPVWIATLGRGALSPSRVSPTLDCAGRLVGSKLTASDRKALCEPTTRKESDAARRRFMRQASVPISLDQHVTWPYSWDFLSVLLCLAFCLDRRHQSAAACRFAKDKFPDKFEPAQDQTLDRAIARTKWQLYAAIRCFLFVMALGYMGIIYLLGIMARDASNASPSGEQLFFVVTLGFIGWSVYCTVRMLRQFVDNYRQFARCVGATLLPWSWRDLREAMAPSSTDGRVPSSRQPKAKPPVESAARAERPRSDAPPVGARLVPAPASAPRKGLMRQLVLSFGFLQAHERQDVARTSFAQLRILTGLAVFFALAFSAVLWADTADVADLSFGADSWHAYQRLTLTALRAVQLTSGISPSTPSLLCMICVYVWASGRMARLALAHSISRASPADGETDLVSTPIRMILYPGYVELGTPDAGFTEVERDLLNAIWRPLTGRYYPLAAATLGVFPVVLFLLKPFSTLEGRWGTLFLGGGLALSAALIGFTLVQLIQYWFALERLLKRTLEHPLGAAFRHVPAFAKDSIDQLLSGSSDEVLRWAACTRKFRDLQRAAAALDHSELLATHLTDINRVADELSTHRFDALSGDSEGRFSVPAPATGAPPPELSLAERDEKRAQLEAELAQGVIRAAAMLTGILENAWTQSARAHEQVEAARPARISGQVELSWQGGFGSGSLALAEGHEPPQAGDGLPKAPRAVALVTGSSTPPPPPPPHRATSDSQASFNPVQETDTLAALGPRYPAEELAWLRSAQSYAATVVTLLIHRHIKQFRYFLWVTTGCALLLLLAVTSYSFEPYRLMLTFMWFVIGSVVLAGLMIFVQLDRNTLVSYIAGTRPDQLTWNASFFTRILSWVVIPLLGVAAAQYPQIANVLSDLIGPFAHALR